MEIYSIGDSLHIDQTCLRCVEISLVTGSLQVVVDNGDERASIYLDPAREALVAIRDWAVKQLEKDAA